MFKILNEINRRLFDRYETVETNIKAKSNSFYESLLALLEDFSRNIAEEQSITIPSEYDTFIGIIRVKEFEKYLLNIGINKEDYENLFMLGKTINAHKHSSEKQITLQSVLSFLEDSYRYFAIYYKVKTGKAAPKFTSEKITELYGQTEKEIALLKSEKQKLEESLLKESNITNLLQSDLERIKSIKENDDKKYNNLEDQKNDLLKQLNELKDIKLSSLDEKMNKIIASLTDQIAILKSVNATLQETNKILSTRNFSGVHPVRITR